MCKVLREKYNKQIIYNWELCFNVLCFKNFCLAKTLKSIRFIWLFLFIYSSSFAVDSIPDPASFNILLVKLKTDKNRIEILKKRGYINEAKSIELKQAKENKEIIESFKNFTVCPVYFFFSHDQDSVICGNKINYIFTADTHLISNQKDIACISNNSFLIGEYGNLSTLDFSISAFYLSDSRYKMLSKPYPYYVRSRYFFVKKTKKVIVEELVKNLEKIKKLKTIF